MLNELVEHIEVYSTEKIDGVRAQRFVIYYQRQPKQMRYNNHHSSAFYRILCLKKKW